MSYHTGVEFLPLQRRNNQLTILILKNWGTPVGGATSSRRLTVVDNVRGDVVIIFAMVIRILR